MAEYVVILPKNEEDIKETQERIHEIHKKYDKVIDYEITYNNYTIDNIREAILETPIVMTQIHVNVSNVGIEEIDNNITTELSEVGIGSGFIKLDTPVSEPIFRIKKLGGL